MKNRMIVVSISAAMAALWMLGCRGDGDVSTGTELEALQACLADSPCKECYEQCVGEEGDEGACRDECCRSHGGKQVRAYCEARHAACRDEGDRESCRAHGTRCPKGERPDGGLGMRGEGCGHGGRGMDGEGGPGMDSDHEGRGERDGMPEGEGDLPEEE